MSEAWVNVYADAQREPLQDFAQHRTRSEAEDTSRVVADATLGMSRTLYRVHIKPKR